MYIYIYICIHISIYLYIHIYIYFSLSLSRVYPFGVNRMYVSIRIYPFIHSTQVKGVELRARRDVGFQFRNIVSGFTLNF